ncbi:thymidylate synthase [Achromatium sp. WMS1]|nr:thymidylate synthase [Achromatium sp. WMS1]
MKSYLDLLRDTINIGILKENRTGIGALSRFGCQIRHDLTTGFPLLTTKKLHFKSIAYELMWFLRGDTNKKWLNAHGVTIWDEWATEQGDLGPIYGKQWTAWPTKHGHTINQIENVLELLKHNPNSRRIIFHAWNPEYLPDENQSPQANVHAGKMALSPCHLLYQFYVAQERLSTQLYIRSSDVFLGLPYNIASVALLTHMLAQHTKLQPGEVIIILGDTHLYHNHMEQAKLQLTRTPLPLPTLQIKRLPPSIYDYQFSDFELLGYQSYPHIPASVAI